MKVSPRPIAIVPFDADHTVSNMVAVVASSELLLSKISANMNSKLELISSGNSSFIISNTWVSVNGRYLTNVSNVIASGNSDSSRKKADCAANAAT